MPAEIVKRARRITAHASASLLKPNSQLDYALSNSAANKLPRISVSPLAGQFLAIQCQLIGAKSVLEIGTLGGYSTIWMAKTGAKVTSIEVDPKNRDVAIENTKGLDVDIILGAALDVLPKLAAEGRQFDFVFIDALWTEQWEYFEWAVKLTRSNGVIFVDNAVRAFFESDDPVDEAESLMAKVGREEKVTATLITTAAGQDKAAENLLDGFLLAVVK